jgi:hypothetical protein
MQIIKRTLAAAALVVAATTTAAAQAKAPDFSGQWEMNTSKSDLGPMAGAITKLVFTVQQSPTTLKFSQAVSTTQGDQTIDQELTLDGKEITRTIPTGQTVVTTAKVEGDAIVLAGKLQGGEGGQTSRWTLAPDGKSMTIDQQMSGPMGALTMKFVLDKK